jgi:hypothetical protein
MASTSKHLNEENVLNILNESDECRISDRSDDSDDSEHLNVHHTKKTTPTRWLRKRRTAGANVNKAAGQVEHNRNRTPAGCYNINKEDTNSQSGQVDDNNFNEYNKATA